MKLSRIALGMLPMSITLVSLTGCYSGTEIRPTELPKLNGAFAEPVAQTSSTTIYAVSVRQVERTDGTLLSVSGPFNVVVATDSAEVDFDRPVEAQLAGGTLSVRGGNRPWVGFDLSDLKKVEVRQMDRVLTTLLGIGIGLAAGGIFAGVMFGTVGVGK